MNWKGAHTVLRKSGIAASFVLAFFIAPFSAYAEDIGSITTVDYAGASITLNSIVKKSYLLSDTQYWNVNFAWPEPVFFGTGRTFVGIFKGAFGHIEGGALQQGINYSYQKPGFSSGMQSFGANYSLPSLLNPLTESGTYTILVAEYPFSNYNDTTLLNWFASGGAVGTKEPYRYTALSFSYDATETPIEIPGAIQGIEYAGRNIVPGDLVYRKEVSPSENSYWNFKFNWPNAVQNNKALLMVFRGSYGNVDGGVPVSGVNYGYNLQAWSSGANEFGKFINLPLLRASTTPPGIYTIMVAERSASSISQSPDQQALWFASGGAQGIGPTKYSLFTFEYKKYSECCSSVAFIPGLKGSKLSIGSDTIWPPSLFSNDVPQLALTVDGHSVNDVKVTGILDSFYGVPIYSGFETYLQSIRGSVIHDWKSLPYDWRLAPDTIVNQGVQTPAGVSYLKTEIENLAEDSDTGKVNIVAHSYGGLVGKQLIRKLEEAGEAGLVDSFVMVGSPQLGTPQAIASLLHGDGESIFGGIVVQKAASRTVAQNMPSTYMLLPSQEYFARATDPVITFNPSASFTSEWSAYWGPGINSFLNFFSFATGGGVTRTKPQPFETQKPEILNPTILGEADAQHSALDTMQFPSNIHVVQIAGWGLPTVKSIEYRNEHFQQSYRTGFTIEGDGTVVYPSAAHLLLEPVQYFDLFSFNKLQNSLSINHSNLLASVPVQNALRSIFLRGPLYEDEFITQAKPDGALQSENLLVSTHSPVTLGAFDLLGRYTGVRPEQTNGSEFLFIAQEIPGSSFFEAGGSQYIFLPKSGTYTFVYRGTGLGSTTVEISNFANDSETVVATYTDIPTTEKTEATFSVDTQNLGATVIGIDTDGDKVADMTVRADSEDPTLEELIKLLKQRVLALNTKDTVKKQLLRKIDSLEKKIARQKKARATKVVVNIEMLITKKVSKGRISDAEANEVLLLLSQLENKL